MKRHRFSIGIIAFGIAILGAVPALAQNPAWDPKDFSGIWHADGQRDITTALLPGEEISFTPYGAERYRNVDIAKSPGNTCLPSGIQRSIHGAFPFMITMSKDVIANIFEYQSTYRLIYIDGRSHPEDIYEYPLWFGHSLGKWEGNVLVVDSIGFDPRTWMDSEGLEHSEKLRLTEWFERTGPDTIKWTAQVDDPVFFTKPFKYSEILTRQDTRLMPSFCLENERDVAHMLPTPGGRHERKDRMKFPN
jgi:hypothetical protein